MGICRYGQILGRFGRRVRWILHGPVKPFSGEESTEPWLRFCPMGLRDDGYLSSAWEESGKCPDGRCYPDGVRQVQLLKLSEAPDYNVYRVSFL